MSFPTFKRRAVHLLLSVATLAALAVCGAVAVAAGATTGPSVVTGRGTWIANHTDFVGYYRANVNGRWLKVYCVSPDRLVPVHITLHTVSSLPAANAARTRLAAQTLNAHGDAQTDTQAEAVSQAVNEEVGNHDAVVRRAKYLPQAVLDLAARYVAEARNLHGPYTLNLRLPTSPLPGQSGTGSASLASATRGVPGTVTLRHTANVELPATVRTDRSGRASFGYRTVGGGAVHVSATARVAPTRVQASLADRSTQVMLTWTRRVVVRSTATYQAHGPRFTHRYACTATCDGHPLVTLTACASADSFPSRITYWYDGHAHRIDFPASTARNCVSWATHIADAISVSATWRYRTPNGWTPALPAAGAFVVDCPAAPQVAVLLNYDCQHATFTAVLGSQQNGALTPARNATRHPMVLELSGALAGRYPVGPGATSDVHTFPLTCGSHASVTVRGGVRRSNGDYNYGQPATVTLP